MFKDTHLFSPVILDGLTRAHPRSIDYAEWWDEQFRRCKEGYIIDDVRITGNHYFYLNFWKIRGVDKKTGRKDLIAPDFIDMDYEFFHDIEDARLTGKNQCFAKRRQVGYSEKVASLAGHEFTFFNNSQTVILAGEEKYSNNTMRMVIRGLNSLKGTEFYKRRSPDTLDHIQARYKVVENGVPIFRGSNSEIYNITCKNNPQATAGKSPSLAIFEESGRFPGIRATYRYLQPSLETNFVKTGFAVMIGTGGEMDNGADELEDIFYDPEGYDMYSYENHWGEGLSDKLICRFVPAWKFAVIDKDGNSLKEPSMEKINESRSKSLKSKDPNSWIQQLTQMPLTPEECFMRTGGNMFDAGKLNARLAEIRRSRELSSLAQKGDLEWVRDNNGKITGVEWTPNVISGKFLIYEHPMKDGNGNVFLNLYKAATDSYDKDQANTSKSKGSCQVFKTFKDINTSANKFVARCTERPEKAEEFHEMSAKLCYYYMCANLIEWSNISIFNWYERHGLTHFLKERPRVAYANVKDSKVNNKFGVDPSTKEYWLIKYRDYIKDNVDKMDDIDQIIAAINYRDEKGYNCDVTISSSLCLVHAEDDMSITVKAKETKKTEFFHYTTGKDGRFQHKFN